jgi:CheY-like chemotaxis protein
MGSAAKRSSLPTILIVEDEFLARAMLSDHLQESGFMVLEAANADEAISTIKSGLPIDLVLTDVRMPGSINGFGVAKRISHHIEAPLTCIAFGAVQIDAARDSV